MECQSLPMFPGLYSIWCLEYASYPLQGRRKRSSWSDLGRTNFRRLVTGGCGNMRLSNIGGCGNMLLARAACESMQRADPEQLQNVEKVQQAS